jgi:hypothetical protein
MDNSNSTKEHSFILIERELALAQTGSSAIRGSQPNIFLNYNAAGQFDGWRDIVP